MNFNEKAGDRVLTSKSKLKGSYEFGEDHYTGTYEATYKKFKGEEVIFGGTTIERDSDNIHIELNVENFENMTYKILPKENYFSKTKIDLFYTNSFVNTVVSTTVDTKAKTVSEKIVDAANTGDYILGSIFLAIISFIGIIILIVRKYNMSKKMRKI